MFMLADIKFKGCAYPPSNDFLQREICRMIEQGDYNQQVDLKERYYRLKHYLEKYNADQRWLLGVCYTIDPNNDIFKSNYRPPELRVQAPVNQPMVSNSDLFFSNLPLLNAKEQKKHANNALFLTKEQRLQQQQQRLIQRQAKTAAQIQKVANDLQDAERKNNEPPQVKISQADFELLQVIKQQNQNQHEEIKQPN